MNSRTCFVYGAAQTEQIAAIFSRRPSIPCSGSSAWASPTIRDDRSLQSGDSAHSSPSEAMKTPSKPCWSA